MLPPQAWSVPLPFEVNVRPKSDRATIVVSFQASWAFNSATNASKLWSTSWILPETSSSNVLCVSQAPRCV